MNKKYTCMWCGHFVFNEVFSEYEICPICGFQDCFESIEHPSEKYFEYDKSLSESQNIPLNFQSKYKLNPLWKKINQSKIDVKYSYFPLWKYNEFIDKYWWDKIYEDIFIEAQKHNPDDKVHQS